MVWQAKLRKRLSYRDLGSGTLESHTAGWGGFSWTSGPVQVASYGQWGKVQVYASTEAEGKRVIRHAAGLASYDLDADPGHQWIVGQHQGGRIGRVATMIPQPVPGGIAVRMRDGSDGRSETVVHG